MNMTWCSAKSSNLDIHKMSSCYIYIYLAYVRINISVAITDKRNFLHFFSFFPCNKGPYCTRHTAHHPQFDIKIQFCNIIDVRILRFEGARRIGNFIIEIFMIRLYTILSVAYTINNAINRLTDIIQWRPSYTTNMTRKKKLIFFLPWLFDARSHLIYGQLYLDKNEKFQQ